MKKKAFINLARAAGFPVGNIAAEHFEFEAAIGFQCMAFLYFARGTDEVISMQLFCGFANAPNQSDVDYWNRDMRFVKAYRSAGDQLALEMDLITRGDVSSDNLNEAWQIWNQLLFQVPMHFAH